jgi:hypothetical protein
MGSLTALKAPQHILAALELLQFQNASADRFAFLSDSEQRQFTEWCDFRQLTLLLPYVCGSQMPAWVHERIVQTTARYELRFKRLKQELFEIVEALDASGLEFVMLKGLSHAPALTPEARFRAQGDIDLWLIGSSVYKARDVLTSMGYVPLLASKSRHLAPMGRPSSWKWQGDLFDPSMPVSVELHYELWSEQEDYIAVPELQQFWERKQLRAFDGHKINVLCDEDLLGFAALHLLLHLLHGELPLQRAWEIARFLDTHVNDDLFWESWRNSHSIPLRHLETAVFHLVTKWFDCHSRQELGADFQRLPAKVKCWLGDFWVAPLAREWAPNKSEVWLHLALISERKYKARVLFRRLIPHSLPTFGDRAISQPSSLAKLLRSCRQLRLLTTRISRHLVTFFPTVFEGVRWFWLGRP